MEPRREDVPLSRETVLAVFGDDEGIFIRLSDRRKSPPVWLTPELRLDSATVDGIFGQEGSREGFQFDLAHYKLGKPLNVLVYGGEAHFHLDGLHAKGSASTLRSVMRPLLGDK